MGTNFNSFSDADGPALAFFYGGLVRRKNLVSTLVQCIIIFAVVSLVWFFWGYSFVYGKSIGGVIGFSPSLFGLNGITINTITLTHQLSQNFCFLLSN